MSDMQEENNKKAAKKEDKRSVVSQALTLEGKEVRAQSSRIKVQEQDDKTVTVRIALEDKEFTWYTITIKIPKDRIKNIYAIPTD